MTDPVALRSRAYSASFSSQAYPTGNISKYFSELKVGDLVNARGPKGQMKYQPGYASNIGMIAGGTGITPMLVRPHPLLRTPSHARANPLLWPTANYPRRA